MEEDNKKFDLLQKQIKGKVLYNELSRSLYSSGASLYRIKPKVIVQPKSKDDLVKTIKFAREHKIPITARGGGTSRTGN
ncbi:MAG: FAD-binding oxidoreductase, partial [Desulfobacula sp.]|nr:FAD-binding oxidoreductase [Desulfobacula sp.]